MGKEGPFPGWPGSWMQTSSPPPPGKWEEVLQCLALSTLQQGRVHPLPSNPGLFSMHNHCKGTLRPG